MTQNTADNGTSGSGLAWGPAVISNIISRRNTSPSCVEEEETAFFPPSPPGPVLQFLEWLGGVALSHNSGYIPGADKSHVFLEGWRPVKEAGLEELEECFRWLRRGRRAERRQLSATV